MVLQAYIDDSYTPNGVYVLAGFIANERTWADFSRDWEELLPLGVRNKNWRFRFKMAEMASLPERMDRVIAFWKAIQRHNLIAISCAFNRSDLSGAKRRIRVEQLNIDWGFLDIDFTFAFKCLLDMFHSNRDKVKFIPPHEKVDFIFDKQSEEKKYS